MSANPLCPAASDALSHPVLRAKLKTDAVRQLDFFRNSLRADGGFDVLDLDGEALSDQPQELHTTTRLVHSYALGHLAGVGDCEAIVDAGIQALLTRHRDVENGGYAWAFSLDGTTNGDKLAYGHMFVLLAASSARAAGHPDADWLIDDVERVISRRFWDDEFGLMQDEFRRDWQQFSTYRGMNANMHGVEAHLAAFEVTGREIFLERAGRILAFFLGKMAPAHGWRIPEHYTAAWQVDRDYAGNPMFRPQGTTPGHSFELGRLQLQYWDLCGRPDTDAPHRARQMIETALKDAWLPDGGFAYTLDFSGKIAVTDRYWWPLTEAIGAVATLLKLDATEADATWYNRLWESAFDLFIDTRRGGWFPEIDAAGQPAANQFVGKPDIYHALQADLLPLMPGLSDGYKSVRGLLA
tara:strand:- start:1567 stop:2799 length:1233 start_codon:yes stop_codon:yes gene_type:complete